MVEPRKEIPSTSISGSIRSRRISPESENAGASDIGTTPACTTTTNNNKRNERRNGEQSSQRLGHRVGQTSEGTIEDPHFHAKGKPSDFKLALGTGIKSSGKKDQYKKSEENLTQYITHNF